MGSSTTATTLKIIIGADPFGTPLKDAVIAHLRSLNTTIDDLGTSAYYSIGAEVGRRISSDSSNTTTTTRGIVICGTGVGVSIFANKFPGVFAATCLTPSDAINARSINNCNVLALSGMYTPPDNAIDIVNAWLDTSFNSPCPASENKPWPADLKSFLDDSLAEMPQIGTPVSGNGPIPEEPGKDGECSICCLVKNRELSAIDLIPGGSMKIVRESPTSAFVRFKAGSVEPAHHHTFGHCLVVKDGKKRVWNLSKSEVFDLSVGDYLYTPAGDVHRVVYYEDTEFFIKWDGHWDLFFDEDFDAARKAVQEDGEEDKA